MRSLKRRLIAIVALSVAIAFLFIAFLCWRVVTAAVERDFDARLSGAMSDLLSAADRGQDGILSLAQTPGDPVFNRPHSGWYWSISDGNTVLARSRSLPLGERRQPRVVRTFAISSACLRCATARAISPFLSQGRNVLSARKSGSRCAGCSPDWRSSQSS